MVERETNFLHLLNLLEIQMLLRTSLENVAGTYRIKGLPTYSYTIVVHYFFVRVYSYGIIMYDNVKPNST